MASSWWAGQAYHSPHPGKQWALSHFRLVSGCSQRWVCLQVESGFPEVPPGLTCVVLSKQPPPTPNRPTQAILTNEFLVPQ